MIPAQFLRALRRFHVGLLDTRVEWAVTGSLGMVLQGMDLTVHDIDIQTDKAGAYEIQRRFAEHVVSSVRFTDSVRMRSYLGKLEIYGIQVEVIGSIQKRLQDGTWERPVDVKHHRLWVEIDGMRIPVLSLEYEHEAYRLMGRLEKAELLRKWLEIRPSE